MKPMNPSATIVAPGRLRRLKWHELVRHGDFVENGRQGYEPWEGPPGFRAGSFIKTIYRRQAGQPVALREAP
jgi:hypothetical protein